MVVIKLALAFPNSRCSFKLEMTPCRNFSNSNRMGIELSDWFCSNGMKSGLLDCCWDTCGEESGSFDDFCCCEAIESKQVDFMEQEF